MEKKRTKMRPSLEQKLQEYLFHSKEYHAFRELTHEFLVRTFSAGASGKYKSFDQWREELAKEEAVKHQRERSSSIQKWT